MGDKDTLMNFKDEPQEGQKLGTEVLCNKFSIIGIIIFRCSKGFFGQEGDVTSMQTFQMFAEELQNIQNFVGIIQKEQNC